MVGHCKYSSILYYVGLEDKARYWSKIAIFFFIHPLAFDAPLGGPLRNIAIPFGVRKLEWCGYPAVKKSEDTYNGFDRIPACDRQTDGRTDILRRHSPHYAQHRAVKTYSTEGGKGYENEAIKSNRGRVNFDLLSTKLIVICPCPGDRLCHSSFFTPNVIAILRRGAPLTLT